MKDQSDVLRFIWADALILIATYCFGGISALGGAAVMLGICAAISYTIRAWRGT